MAYRGSPWGRLPWRHGRDRRCVRARQGGGPAHLSGRGAWWGTDRPSGACGAHRTGDAHRDGTADFVRQGHLRYGEGLPEAIRALCGALVPRTVRVRGLPRLRCRDDDLTVVTDCPAVDASPEGTAAACRGTRSRTATRGRWPRVVRAVAVLGQQVQQLLEARRVIADPELAEQSGVGADHRRIVVGSRGARYRDSSEPVSPRRPPEPDCELAPASGSPQVSLSSCFPQFVLGQGDGMVVPLGRYRARVEQDDVPVVRPPSAVAVAAAELLPPGAVVLAVNPSEDLTPNDQAQVLEGLGGRLGAEVGDVTRARRLPGGGSFRRLSRVRRRLGRWG